MPLEGEQALVRVGVQMGLVNKVLEEDERLFSTVRKVVLRCETVDGFEEFVVDSDIIGLSFTKFPTRFYVIDPEIEFLTRWSSPFIEQRYKSIGLKTTTPTNLLLSNRLTSLPKEISQLTNLTHLNLSGNRLTSLPKEISQLTNLTHLDLSGNNLTSLPAEIWQLTNLTSLDLFHNELMNLPIEIGQLANLEVLKLFRNQLTNLPAEIGQLKNLILFYLSDNQLTSLPAEIGQLTQLKCLYLSGNNLTSLPTEIRQLNLWRLYSKDNPISDLEKGKIRFLFPKCDVLL